MNTAALDDKALRKAWLKQKFGSFEYHEEMLRHHHELLRLIHKALHSAESGSGESAQGSHIRRKERAAYFRKRYLPLMEQNDDLGKYRKEDWDQYRHTATFRSVMDYDRYLHSEEDAFDWLTYEEQVEQGKEWGAMAQMAENIRYTVDGNWDSHPDRPYWILEEKYTGPITWPSDWKQQLLGGAASLVDQDALRVRAGDPVPLSGLWRALDVNVREQRVNAGEVLPDLKSAYGLTVWQRVSD